MCFRCFGLFLINERVYLKGKLKFAYPKETGSWVCNIIPRAFGVKYLLQRTLCLILLKWALKNACLVFSTFSRDENHLKCLNFTRNEIPLI